MKSNYNMNDHYNTSLMNGNQKDMNHDLNLSHNRDNKLMQKLNNSKFQSINTINKLTPTKIKNENENYINNIYKSNNYIKEH